MIIDAADLAVQAISHAYLITKAAVVLVGLVLVRRLLIGEAVNATIQVSQALVTKAATVLVSRDLVAEAATVLVGQDLVAEAAVAHVGQALMTDAAVAVMQRSLSSVQLSYTVVISFGVSWS